MSGTNLAASLNVDGDVYALTGDFAFEQRGDDFVVAAVNNLTLDFGTLVEVTEGELLLVVTEAGVAAEGSANVNVTAPGVTVAGTYGVAINTTTVAQNHEFEVGGETKTIDLDAGALIQAVSYTHLTLPTILLV